MLRELMRSGIREFFGCEIYFDFDYGSSQYEENDIKVEDIRW